MSVRAMGQVWELDLPHQELLILLALADHADHEGRHVRPSFALIAWKTGYSKRQVIRVMQTLEAKRLIRVSKEGGGRGRATEYTLTLHNGVKKSPFRKDDVASPIDENDTSETLTKAAISDIQNSDTMTPITLKSDTTSLNGPIHGSDKMSETVTIATSKGDIAMSPEPSLEPLEEKPKDNTPPLTPQGGMSEGDTTAGLFNRSLQKQAKEVLNYLNKVTGKRYPGPRNITAVLRDKKGTVAQCVLVIDWWQQSWSLTHSGQADLLNPDTPFKPEKFEIYLTDAQHWHEGGRQAPTIHVSRNGTSRQQERDQRNEEIAQWEKQEDPDATQ